MFKFLIGCGGAGVSTLLALGQRLARSRSCDSGKYAFLAVDTDGDRLSCFDDLKEELARNGFRPSVRSVRFDRDDIQEIVQKHFVEPFAGDRNPEGLDRLQKHWWHDEGGRPYRGRFYRERYRAVDSYGVAWHDLGHSRRIENAIRELLNQARFNCNPDQLADAKVFVIASLAEETGRGLWSLVSFKVRETLFRDYGCCVRPTGILYDATVYETDGPWDSNIRRMVNSLTGLSELSVWLDNEKRDKPASCHLPSMEGPAREELDVIRADGDSPLAEGPIGDMMLIARHPAERPSIEEVVMETADALYLKLEGDQ